MMSPRLRPSSASLLSPCWPLSGFVWAKRMSRSRHLPCQIQFSSSSSKENSTSTIETKVLSLIPVAKFDLSPSLNCGMCWSARLEEHIWKTSNEFKYIKNTGIGENTSPKEISPYQYQRKGQWILASQTKTKTNTQLIIPRLCIIKQISTVFFSFVALQLTE